MSQHYCDSTALERNWFYWLLSSSTPALEQYRSLGLLWTKILGRVTEKDGSVVTKNGQPFPDPCHPNRAHCVALPVPIFFNSYQNTIPDYGVATLAGVSRKVSLPDSEVLNLLSDSWLHRLDEPFVVQEQVIPNLVAKGYVLELPTFTTWHMMLEDIERICLGIAAKFNLPSDEERLELAHDALLQVTKKLIDRKLVYTPGKAPVFNLLTTTIFRCMYSIQNRKKNQREGMSKLIDNMQAGTLPDNIRSFRAGMVHKKHAARLIRAH